MFFNARLRKTKFQHYSLRHVFRGFLIVAVCGVPFPFAFAADNYQIIDLGKFEDGVYNTEGIDVNSNGLVVGHSLREQVVETTDATNTVVTETVQFMRAFTFEQESPELTDLGAVDNSELFVDITNINPDSGEPELTTVDLSEPFTSSFATAVNEQDTVIGFSFKKLGFVSTSIVDSIEVQEANSRFISRAIISQSGGLEEIPDFIEETPSDMRAIGISGNLVVGYGLFDDPEDVDENGDGIDAQFRNGFVYDIDSKDLIRVAPLATSRELSLRDINSSGYAVGVASSVVDNRINFVVVGYDLSTQEPARVIEIFGEGSQQAWAINDHGVFVGQALRPGGTEFTAFSYDLNTNTAKDLGVLNENFVSGVARDINNLGQIVGSSQVQNSPVVHHAFLYENGELKDLDKLIGCNTGWRLDEAFGISESGVIVGKGVINGQIRGFMLKPIEGTAPSCEVEEEKSGSGSLPFISLVGLLLLGFRRARV